MEGSWRKAAGGAGNAHNPQRERALSELARGQHAVFALWQVKPLGLTADAARKRVAAGRLHRVHHGVCAVVHPDLLTRDGRFMAAVLACGPGAVLSHRSAAALHDLRLRTRAMIDVSAPGHRGRRRAGIGVHSAATARLQPDAVNHWIAYPGGGGAEADFLWRAQRLIVEVDGRDPHTTRRAFEHDRRRDQRLAVLGYRVVRFTWRQVMFEPACVAQTLATLLSRE